MAIQRGSLPPSSPPTPPSAAFPGRRRRWGAKQIAWLVAVVVVLALAGAGAAALYFYRGIGEALEPAESAAEEFVLDLEASDWAGAYDGLCHEAQTDYSVSDFATEAQKEGVVKDHTIVRTYVSERNGDVTGTVVMDLKLADGSTDTHTFHLVQEGKQWKVCGRPY